jgi:hypothetical protein
MEAMTDMTIEIANQQITISKKTLEIFGYIGWGLGFAGWVISNTQ